MYLSQTNPRAAFVLSPGNRVYSQLVNAVRTYWLDFTFSATVTVGTADLSAIRNRGSVLALFDFMGLLDNGKEIANLDPRLARFLNQMYAPQPGISTSLAVAQGTYNLRETVRLFFANPLSITPSETSYVEDDVTGLLQAFVVYNGDATNIGVTAGSGTLTISNPNVSIRQVYDTKRADRPLFRQTYRQIYQNVAGAVNLLPVSLKTRKGVRAIAMGSFDQTVGEVDDIVSSFVLRGDNASIVGPGAIAYGDAVADMANDFGGDVDLTTSAYWGINFQKSGRLSSVLSPNQDAAQNLRSEITGQPTSAAGATSSAVVFAMSELERVPGVTADKIPFNV